MDNIEDANSEVIETEEPKRYDLSNFIITISGWIFVLALLVASAYFFIAIIKTVLWIFAKVIGLIFGSIVIAILVGLLIYISIFIYKKLKEM